MAPRESAGLAAARASAEFEAAAPIAAGEQRVRFVVAGVPGVTELLASEIEEWASLRNQRVLRASFAPDASRPGERMIIDASAFKTHRWHANVVYDLQLEDRDVSRPFLWWLTRDSPPRDADAQLGALREQVESLSRALEEERGERRRAAAALEARVRGQEAALREAEARLMAAVAGMAELSGAVSFAAGAGPERRRRSREAPVAAAAPAAPAAARAERAPEEQPRTAAGAPASAAEPPGRAERREDSNSNAADSNQQPPPRKSSIRTCAPRLGECARTPSFVFKEPEPPVFAIDHGKGIHPRFRPQALNAPETFSEQEQSHTYLDYTGGGLACQSQVKRLFKLLRKHVLGNPHSMSPTSNVATALEADARKAVLTFFNVPDDYAVVFTANASGALRIVGECYAFGPDAPLLLSADNHNSVGGIREFARAKGASVTYVPLTDELFMDEAALFRALREKPAGQRGLFAYPAQSNVSGVKHPLAYAAAAREAGWDVLLDASAFVPTSALDVAKWRPDFVAMSFYKMFGFPTGIGCLLLRHGAAARLRKPYFAGGTVTLVTQQTSFHILESNPARMHAVFEP
eukprot:tig00020629_g12327.t1